MTDKNTFLINVQCNMCIGSKTKKVKKDRPAWWYCPFWCHRIYKIPKPIIKKLLKEEQSLPKDSKWIPRCTTDQLLYVGNWQEDNKLNI